MLSSLNVKCSGTKMAYGRKVIKVGVDLLIVFFFKTNNVML